MNSRDFAVEEVLGLKQEVGRYEEELRGARFKSDTSTTHKR